MTNAPETYHLIGIRFSHYVEKVRWTLDRFEVPYTETCLMPILHFLVTPWVMGLRGSPDAHSTRFSTPILKIGRNQTLSKSSHIMKVLNEKFKGEKGDLYPTKEVEELDEYYNNFLGPHTRRLFYINVLNDPQQIFALANKNVSKAQARAFQVAFALFKRGIEKSLVINRPQVEKGLNYIYKEFDAVEKKLKDGRPYLMGDQFTAADISFCCMGGSAVLPSPQEGFGAYLPQIGSTTEELNRLCREFRDSMVGKWVLKMFREEHGRRLIPAVPNIF